MKTKTEKFEGITLWKDNLIANEIFIPSYILKIQFKQWIKTKELDWLEYYWFEAACRSFLTDKEPGCQGTFDEKDFDGVYLLLLPIAKEYMKSNGR